MKFHFVILFLFFCSFFNVCSAQTFPTKAIKWIIPSPAGDGADVTARLVADSVSRLINQPIIIDNKPGVGGIIGSELVAKSAPDGYTMIVGNAGSHSITPAIYNHLNYDSINGFIPIALFCTAPNVMVVNPALNIKNVNEFINYAKKNSKPLNYASAGVGSSAHMSTELFKSMTGVEIMHIPYKGTVPAATALVSGEVDLMIANLPGILSEFIKAGRIQPLAVTSANRIVSLPNLPTLKEYLPEFETVAWYGLFAPAGTPQPIIDKMNYLVNSSLESADIKAKFRNIGCEPSLGSSKEFSNRVNKDIARWKKLSLEKNIKTD